MGEVINFRTRRTEGPGVSESSEFFGLPRPERFCCVPGEAFYAEFQRGQDYLALSWQQGSLLTVAKSWRGIGLPTYELRPCKETFVATVRDFFGLTA